MEELDKIAEAWETIMELPPETMIAVLASPEATRVWEAMAAVREKVDKLIQQAYN